MGYEVLDPSGHTPMSDDGPPAGRDVVVLDDWAAPEPTVSSPPWPVLRGRVAATVRAALTAPPTARRAVAVVVVSLAVGALGGAVLAARHLDQRRLAAARTELSVLASTTNFATVPNGEAGWGELTAQLTNFGPRPIAVVTRTGQSGPTVVMESGSSTVGPRAQASVRLLLPVDCAEPFAERPTVPVRTEDGRRHEVPIDLRGTFGDSSLRDAVCGGVQNVLSAELAGQLARPVLVVTNVGKQDLRISLSGSIGFAGEADANRDVVLETVPRTPLRLEAGASVDLALTITVRECPADIADVSSGNGYVSVDGVQASGAQSGAGVDVSTLIGAALNRACSR